MGLRVYAGPVLIVPRKEVATEINIESCDNKSCAEYHKYRNNPTKFCCNCGQAIQRVSKSQISIEPTFGTIYELLSEHKFDGDTFSPLDRDRKELKLILRPNRRKIGERSLYFEDDLQMLSHKNIKAEEDMYWFSFNFGREIELVKSHYENCVVDWAIVNGYPF